MAKQPISEVDRFMRRFWLIFAACLILVMVPLGFYAVHLESRLDDFGNALRYKAPEGSGQTAEASGDSLDDTDLEQTAMHPVTGQTVYVPAYSHIYHRDGEPQLLTITLSVRNTSLEHEIVLRSVRYFDTNGKLLRSHLDKPLRLGALATAEFLVEREDTSGGSGASFLVEWVAGQSVTEPVVEAVMIGTDAQQGISFARRGMVIKELAVAEAETLDAETTADEENQKK